jgi:hypothetical protein
MVVLLSLDSSAAAESQTVSFSSLLDEMVDRDVAGRFPYSAYTCRQASSYDQASVSAEDAATWWANNDRSFFIRCEQNGGREEWVMMDAEGPGCIVRIWITASNACGTIRFYLDGADTPVIAEEAQKLIGDSALVGPPLSKTRARGRNLYLPIPYAKRCKITYDRPNFQQTNNGDDLLYYQINYRTYEPTTKVESFSLAAFNAAETRIARLQDELLAPAAAVPPDLKKQALPVANLAAGQSVQTTITGPAAVRRLVVRLEAEDMDLALRQTVLRAEFDGDETVWCPVGDFFGSGVGVNPYRGWWREIRDDGQMICYWPMPCREKGQITLHNMGKQPVKTHLQADVGSWMWDDRSMYFHANWRQESDVDSSTKSDWNYIQTKGRGVYMGDTLCVVNPVKAWWGEGDEKIYVDGETFPSHFGTGTEDYYGYAWCTPEFFESPFHAQPRAQGPANFGHVTNTRVRLLDGIPFTKSLKVDMEVWHWRPCVIPYAVATYWYGLAGATSNRGAEPDSLQVFHFELPPAPKPRRVEGALEGEDLKVAAVSGGTIQIQQGHAVRWSSDKQLWWIDGEPGDKLKLIVPVEQEGTYQLVAELTKAVDYGIVQVYLDEESAGEPIDLFNNGVIREIYQLGTHPLKAGDHQLTVEIIGANEQAVKRRMFGLDYLKLEPVTE